MNETGSDFWDDASEVGAVESWTFEGVEGLRRLTGPQVTSAPEPMLFRAQLMRMQLDHVALEQFSATPHSVRRGAREIAAHPTPVLTMIHLLEGEVEVRPPESSFLIGPGESIVLDSRQQLTATAMTPVRALRSVVGIEHIPAALHGEGATVAGPLPRTALTANFVTFIGAVLQNGGEHPASKAPHLITAIAQLQSAVLAEAQQVAEFPVGPAGLRHQIVQQIQQRHTDPHLDVAAIADALHVSVGHAREVFNDGDRTIAAALRLRRVATAARLLRATDAPVRMDRIASEAGFTDVDVFSRAFAHHYGMTPADYHAGGHRRFG